MGHLERIWIPLEIIFVYTCMLETDICILRKDKSDFKTVDYTINVCV